MAAASAASPPRPVDQAEVVAFLASGKAFGTSALKRVDTHAAHLFLTPERAWKLKRAVTYPYLDFGTADQRRAALEAEDRLNRRTAPDLYLGVHAVTRAPDGTLAIDGEGEPVDWLLEMRRFADGALLADRADTGIDLLLLQRLTDRIVAMHQAEAAVPGEGAARIRAILDGNRASFSGVEDVLAPDAVAAVEAAQRAELERHAARLDARARSGRVRHGHGDLHLANIAVIDGAPVPFDCLEFNSELATIDVLYDLAFLLMDLWDRGLGDEANMVANRYLDVFPQGATGYALLPLFVSIRAAIRAHVEAATAQRTGDGRHRNAAARYLALAGAALETQSPRLVAIGGLSGTGKSTLARRLGALMGHVPGARILRSDVFRKRLAGVSPETRLPPSAYSKDASADTYEALLESAADHLRCGNSVILDAVFTDRSEREVTEILAERLRVPFTGLWLDAPEHDRVARVAARLHDASDATAQVVREQSRRSVGELGHWHRLRANRPMDVMVPAARAILDRVRR